MSDEQQKPPEEEETPVPAAPEVDDTFESMLDEAKEMGARAKAVGLSPFRRWARASLENAFDLMDGLLGALEGNKRKKGD